MHPSSHDTLRAFSRGIAIASLSCLTLACASPVHAQGLTTAAIRGTVRTQDTNSGQDAVVEVLNVPAGTVTSARTRAGRFFIQGLATGGPYTVTARIVGYTPQAVVGVRLSIGEQKEISFELVQLPHELDSVMIGGSAGSTVFATAGGVGTSISDSALHRLPTLNRDMYDFVRLVPQAGTRFGLTAGGGGFRGNSYLIDGVSDRQLQGNNVMGGPIGGKSISIEALEQYQVLISPYDARYGEFTGLVVNAVTRSGTNELHGSGYGYMRSDGLARSNSFAGRGSYRREQYGFAVGGPVIRNRVHFFIAPEVQRASAPATGPYVGQSRGAASLLPVSEDDVNRFATLLRTTGMDTGSGGSVTVQNPARTLFARLDVALPQWRSRLVLLENYSKVDFTRFARSDADIVFPLSSNAWTLETVKKSSGIQLFTTLSSKVFNEFLLAYVERPILPRQRSQSPSVQTTVRSSIGGADVALIAGPPPPAGGAGSSSLMTEISDRLAFPIGLHHTVGAGIRVELFQYHANGVRGSMGQWTFASLDALAAGLASSYSITKDFGGGEQPVRGVKPGFYVTDEWRLSSRMTVTLGLRGDAMAFTRQPAFNPAVDSILHRSTSDYPRTRIQWSPRAGFQWEPFIDGALRVRGGAGIFTGPPPLGWLLGPMRSNGRDVQTLICSRATGTGAVPRFTSDPANQPQTCVDGSGIAGFANGPVALVDRDLRMGESFRTSLGVDQRLPFGAVGTVEALYTRVRWDFMFINANLARPQAVDAHERVLYGTVDPTGRAHPTNNWPGPEVVDLRNVSGGHSLALTAQVAKPFSNGLELTVAYTHSRSRDVASLTSPSAVAPLDIWASERPLSGPHDDLSTGISAFEIPHRVIVAGTYSAPWKRWRTDFSLYYVGESGSHFTYGDSSSARLGDLNADGTSANDPIYVPTDATDQAEIVFDGDDSAGQGAAFERFIASTPCLRRQRGKIVARNSCSGPWLNTSNGSVRQSLPAIGGHGASIQLEVFNLLNLVNPSWGLFRIPNPNLLQHIRQTTGVSPQPVFRFNPQTAGTSTENLESGYQLQISLRYTF